MTGSDVSALEALETRMQANLEDAIAKSTRTMTDMLKGYMDETFAKKNGADNNTISFLC